MAKKSMILKQQAPAKFSTRQNNAKILFHHQRVGDIQIVSHDPQIAVVQQGMRHGFRRVLGRRRRQFRVGSGRGAGRGLGPGWAWLFCFSFSSCWRRPDKR